MCPGVAQAEPERAAAAGPGTAPGCQARLRAGNSPVSVLTCASVITMHSTPPSSAYEDETDATTESDYSEGSSRSASLGPDEPYWPDWPEIDIDKADDNEDDNDSGNNNEGEKDNDSDDNKDVENNRDAERDDVSEADTPAFRQVSQRIHRCLSECQFEAD